MARSRRRCAIRGEYLETRLYLSRAGLLGAGRVPAADTDSDADGKRDQDAVDQDPNGRPGDEPAGDERGGDNRPGDDRPDSDRVADGETGNGDDRRGRNIDADAQPVVPVTDGPANDAADNDARFDADTDGDGVADIIDLDLDDADRRTRAENDVVVRGRAIQTEPVGPVQEAKPVDTPTVERKPALALRKNTKTEPSSNDATTDDVTGTPINVRLVTDLEPPTDDAPADEPDDVVAVVDRDENREPDPSFRIVPMPFTPGAAAVPTMVVEIAVVEDQQLPNDGTRPTVATPTAGETDQTGTREPLAERDQPTQPVVTPDESDDESDSEVVGELDDSEAPDSNETETPAEAATLVVAVDDQSEESGSPGKAELIPAATDTPPALFGHDTSVEQQTRSTWRPDMSEFGPTWRPSSEKPSLEFSLWVSRKDLFGSVSPLFSAADDANVVVSDMAMLGVLLLVLNRARRRTVSEGIMSADSSFELTGDGPLTERRRRAGRAGGYRRAAASRDRFGVQSDPSAGTAFSDSSSGGDLFSCDAVFADGATMALLYRRDFEAPRDSGGSNSLSAMLGSFLAGGGYAVQRFAQRLRMSRGSRGRSKSKLPRPRRPRYAGPTLS